MNFLREKEDSLQDFLLKSDGQLKGLEESIAFSAKQVEEEEGKLETFESQLEGYKSDVEEKRSQFDAQRQAVDAIRSENLQIQRSQFEAEKKVAVADTSILNLQRSIHQIEEERELRGSQLKQLEEERTEKEQELEGRQKDLQQLQEHHERTREQILLTQQELEQLRQKLAEENRLLDARKNEHDLLKSLIDSMEGYPESVKFLHNNPNWNHQAPILSDIIYVKEAYRAAVENVLEPYLNYYVVNNLKEGLQAIHLLDEHKKERQISFCLISLEMPQPITACPQELYRPCL